MPIVLPRCQENLLKGGLPSVCTSYPGVMLDRYIDTTYQGKLNYQMGSKEISTNRNDGLTLTKMSYHMIQQPYSWAYPEKMKTLILLRSFVKLLKTIPGDK